MESAEPVISILYPVDNYSVFKPPVQITPQMKPATELSLRSCFATFPVAPCRLLAMGIKGTHNFQISGLRIHICVDKEKGRLSDTGMRCRTTFISDATKVSSRLPVQAAGNFHWEETIKDTAQLQ